METIVATLREVQDEYSSRARADKLQGMFSSLIDEIRAQVKLESSLNGDELKAWHRSGFKDRVRSAFTSLGQEVNRLTNHPEIPASFKQALSLEMVDIQKAIDEAARKAASGRFGDELDSNRSRIDAEFASGGGTEVSFTNLPEGSHDIVADRVRAVANSIASCRGYQSKRSGGQMTLTLLGFNDAKLLADKLDLGEVTSLDESKNAFSVRLDTSKLPEDWEEQVRAKKEAEEQARREREEVFGTMKEKMEQDRKAIEERFGIDREDRDERMQRRREEMRREMDEMRARFESDFPEP